MDDEMKNNALRGAVLVSGLLLVIVILLLLRPKPKTNNVDYLRTQIENEFLINENQKIDSLLIESSKVLKHLKQKSIKDSIDMISIRKQLYHEKTRIANLPIDSNIVILAGWLSEEDNN